ncbi:MAG TPA: beta-ketoacyl synthase N-terminal-like domain-containing protein [Actinospica sp.]|nr:beta-ketoacyl synthase N-terminal-like domain-containing protein [Actinospica sp.]
MADEEQLRAYLRKATAELQQTRRQLADLAARAAEPVAIVGAGCRFPGGVRSPEDLWRIVEEGADVIGPLPADRGWPEGDERLAGFEGGFLDDVTGFDAAFFGISDGEARAMDPQQRLLLTTAWEAIERAGIDPAALHGTRTGVYAGLTSSGYAMVLGGGAPPEESLDFIGVGSSPGAASGRIAYLMGFHGPALSIDTACSSSLVALHTAVQALRRDECSLALAGGSSVCVLPYLFLEFERRGSLAKNCRSKSFSAAADGISFAEGVGMVLLERLSDAQANGHPILAVIRGSAVNQDGETNGMSAPSSAAQEMVIRQALADARLNSDQIDVLEGHGVGAAFGDGIEARSLLATYGRERPAQSPARLGSVKSNIGHAQAAGGIAGLIKTMMALRHETIPATLHADEPTTHADWSPGTVRLASEPRPWPRDPERPRRAAVSCFSIAGTNAHLILEEAPEPEPRPTVREPAGSVAIPWLLSGKSAAALRAQAERLRAVAETADPRDVGYSLAFARSAFKHRAVIVSDRREGFLEVLDALASGATEPAFAPAHGRVCLLFPAADADTVAAGEALRAALPAFAAELDALPPSSSPEAAAFAVQVALHRVLGAFGIDADAMAGDGVGLIAAAHCAGALSLEDAYARIAAGADVAGLDLDGAEVPVVPLDAARIAETGADRLVLLGASTFEGSAADLLGDGGSRTGFLSALAALHTLGVAVDWSPAFADLDARTVDVPTYAFQHRHYWLSELSGLASADKAREPDADAESEIVPGFGQRRMGGTKASTT